MSISTQRESPLWPAASERVGEARSAPPVALIALVILVLIFPFSSGFPFTDEPGGAAVPAIALNEGWFTRAGEGVDLHNRTRPVDQGVALIGSSPLVGVGAGRYVTVARERFSEPWAQVVHDVPLLVAAEAGIPAGLVLVSLLVVMGWRSLRRGPETFALFAMFLPFVLVDAYPYTAAQGLVLTALWIGGIEGGRESASERVAASVISALVVIPAGRSASTMIFVERQVGSLRAVGIAGSRFYLEQRTSPTGLLRELLRLRREIRETRPSIVHAHYGTITAFVCALAGGVPLVITFQGSDLNPIRGAPKLRTAIGHLLSQLAALRATQIICVSQQLRDRLWWHRRSAVVLPSGVDTDLFAPHDRSEARRQLGWQNERHVVLFNAAADPPEIKRPDLASAAVDEARSHGLSVRLAVLDGTVDPQRMPLLMNACDCLLLTSDWEGSPNIVKEAIACGLPVVSVDVGDVRERLSGVHPSAVVARDPRELGSALVDILLSGARSNGPDMARQFSLDRTAARLREVYMEALRSARRAPGPAGLD